MMDDNNNNPVERKSCSKIFASLTKDKKQSTLNVLYRIVFQ